jgi:hypothetical protein
VEDRVTTRWRWVLWSIYLIAWTVALLYPVPPETGVEQIDEFISPHRYVIAKTVHVSAYAVLTLLTGWLQTPLRSRPLLMFIVMAHGTLTELCQLAMTELEWSVRIGHLRDVAFDNLGVLIGLLLSWKWWTRES